MPTARERRRRLQPSPGPGRRRGTGHRARRRAVFGWSDPTTGDPTTPVASLWPNPSTPRPKRSVTHSRRIERVPRIREGRLRLAGPHFVLIGTGQSMRRHGSGLGKPPADVSAESTLGLDRSKQSDRSHDAARISHDKGFEREATLRRRHGRARSSLRSFSGANSSPLLGSGTLGSVPARAPRGAGVTAGDSCERFQALSPASHGRAAMLGAAMSGRSTPQDMAPSSRGSAHTQEVELKRRTFVHALGASGILAPAVVSGWAKTTGADSRRRLTPAFENLPVMSRVADASATPSLGATSEQDSDFNLYPLLIGLGPRAERFVETLASSVRVPADAGLYRPMVAAADTSEDVLALRLEKTAIAMLLIDPDDPAACREAMIWAQRLVDAEIDLPLALTFDSRGASQVAAVRHCLPLPLIEVRPSQTEQDAWAVIEAMLPGLPFHQPTLVGVDLYDTRSILRAGPRLVATAVRWRDPESRAVAFERAWSSLPAISPTGVLAWETASTEYSIGDFDATCTLLDTRLGPSATCAVAPYIDPNFAAGERLLSLTVVGA